MTTSLKSNPCVQHRLRKQRLGGAVLAAGVGAACLAPVAAQEETSADVIAVQIRKQGFACDEAKSATRDRRASVPNETVWILRCKNATYRVKLTPDMAAQVERVE